MKNLSFKERFLLIACGLLLFVAIAYVFVINPMDKKIDSRKLELEDRRARDIEYQKIRESNDRLRKEIAEIKSELKSIEADYFADIDIDIMENYIMETFASTDHPAYLNKIESADISTDDIVFPNGQVANQKLICKRITVEYATTDGGYAIPEGDGVPQWIVRDANGNVGYNQDLITQSIENMGNFPDDRDYMYKEFLQACQTIKNNKKIATSVRIHDVTVEDSLYGFLYLRAEIDFYAADLGEDRLSKDQDAKMALEWTGATNVNCDGGMVGMPIINRKSENAWYGTVIDNSVLKDFVNRPYASYFSSAIIAETAKKDMPVYDSKENAYSAATSELFKPKFEDEDKTPIPTNEGETPDATPEA